MGIAADKRGVRLARQKLCCKRQLSVSLVAMSCALTLAACSSLGGSGPSSARINSLAKETNVGNGITIVDLNKSALSRINSVQQSKSFAAVLEETAALDPVIGAGDVLDVSVWEAPPSILFGSIEGGTSQSLGAQNRTVLQQVVSTDGTMAIPFVGRVSVDGMAPAELEREIVRRLAKRANDPQVVVKIVQNETRNVTILGEVATSRRVPIGARGDRVLDILATAGGPRQPVGQTTVQITRGETIAVMPLEKIIEDPRQNVRMVANDVVTVLHQPYSFIALGAVARNAEIPFEGKGISLAQALARTGGLRDDRANIRGIFVFRLEAPEALDASRLTDARRTEKGLVPVVYRLDLSDATGFFVTQDFLIHDKDVIYISTAPGADLMRFVSTVSSLAFSALSIGNVISSASNNNPK
jgi:polysaccharide export outer membrane protein